MTDPKCWCLDTESDDTLVPLIHSSCCLFWAYSFFCTFCLFCIYSPLLDIFCTACQYGKSEAPCKVMTGLLQFVSYSWLHLPLSRGHRGVIFHLSAEYWHYVILHTEKTLYLYILRTRQGSLQYQSVCRVNSAVTISSPLLMVTIPTPADGQCGFWGVTLPPPILRRDASRVNIANSANKMWGTCCWVQLEIAMHFGVYYLLSLLSTIYHALVDSETAGAWCWC